jgi:hypothetical protein
MKFVVDAHLPRSLCVLLERNLSAIEAALENHTLVEIDRLAVKPVA